jgi:hypothetical protein
MLEVPDASTVEDMGGFSTKEYVLRPLWVSVAECSFRSLASLTHLVH